MAATAALIASLPAAANAAVVRTLPLVKHELSAATAKPRHCADRALGRSGVDSVRYRAPMSGYVTTRLRASDRSDWDLTLYDAATRRTLATSAGFGSREVGQTWVESGQTVIAQGCRRKGSDRTATVSFKFLDVKPPRVTGTPSLVRVSFKSRKELERLIATGVDVTHHVHDGEADVVLANAAQGAQLRRMGFSFETEIADLRRHYEKSRRADLAFARQTRASALPSTRESYRVYDDYQTEMKDLAEDNQDIVKPMKLPRNSFQGRELSGLEIAEGVNASEEDGRPVFLLVAMHHAREWPSAESAMEYMHMLVQGYRTGDERITSLLSRVRIVVVPLINPDGFISSRGFPADPADVTGPELNPNLDNPQNSDPEDEDPLRHCTVTGEDPCDADKYLIEGIAPPGGLFSYRRKNCDGAIPDPSVPCELQYGVDPNRNYGEKWAGPGASGDRMSQGYRGTGPWSEPETQGVHMYSQRRHITNIVTVHNVAALVLRPPGLSNDGFAPDEDRMKELGDAMAEETGYTSQYGFQLYDTAGTTEDWNYAAQGAYGFTIEIGPKDGEFHMPYKQGFIDEWTGDAAGPDKGGLAEAFLIAAEAAANPADHSIIEGTAPAGRTLRLRKRFHTITSPFCEQTVEPPVYFTGGPGTLLLPESRCVNPRDPMAVPDKLDTTLKVPSSGAFEWHVNPSTRPFVGKDKVVPGGTQEIGQPEVVEGSGETSPPADSEQTRVHEFEIAEGVDRFELRVNWDNTVEDYDIQVDRLDTKGDSDPSNDEWVGHGTGYSNDPGESATGPSSDEYVFADDPPAGRYRVTIVNFAAVQNNWTLEIKRFDRTEDRVVPGRKEAWTLTCEDSNGNVLSTRGVIVDRGQRVRVDITNC